MSTRLFFVPVFVALTAPACDGGQVGEETITCAIIDREPVGETESAPLGIVPADLIADLSGSFAGDIQWADGGSAAAEIELGYLGGPIEFLEREWVGDGDAIELATEDCRDVLAVEMRIDARSTDGRLAESWTESVLTDSEGASTVGFEVTDGFAGSLDVDAFVPPGDWNETRSFVNLALAPTTVDLTIEGQVASSSDTDDGDGVASAETFPIGDLVAQRP